jgi:hypothetical protein
LISTTIQREDPEKPKLAALLEEMGDDDLMLDEFPMPNDPDEVI